MINDLILLKANSQNCELSALNPLHGCSLADRLFHDLLLLWFTCCLLACLLACFRTSSSIFASFLIGSRAWLLNFSSACQYSNLSCFFCGLNARFVHIPVSFVYNTNYYHYFTRGSGHLMRTQQQKSRPADQSQAINPRLSTGDKNICWTPSP